MHGQGEESEHDVGTPLKADLHPLIADQPGQRPLRHVPVTAQPFARLDAAPGDPGREPVLTQTPAGNGRSRPPVTVELGRAIAGPTESTAWALTGGTASISASSNSESLVLAADKPTARARQAGRPAGDIGPGLGDRRH